MESEGLLPYRRELREGFTLDILQFSPDRSSLVGTRNCADFRLMRVNAHGEELGMTLASPVSCLISFWKKEASNIGLILVEIIDFLGR